jgi:tricorn protease-like protein
MIAFLWGCGFNRRDIIAIRREKHLVCDRRGYCLIRWMSATYNESHHAHKEFPMKTCPKKSLFCLAALYLICLPLRAVDVKDTRLLANPALSEDFIAFVYAGDLWAADLDGGRVRRLTSDEGVESDPFFLPTGA